MAGKKVEIFISYSHRDRDWCERFLRHLEGLSATTSLSHWSDQSLEAGEEWKAEIAEAIDRADLALLLVTPEFQRSSFIQDFEVSRLLKGKRKVFWVHLKGAVWEAAPFAKLQALYAPQQPLADLPEDLQDGAILEICKKIWQLAQSQKQREERAVQRISFLPLRYEPLFVDIDDPRQPMALTSDVLSYRGLEDRTQKLPEHIEVAVCLPHETQAFRNEHLQTVLICTASSNEVSQRLSDTVAPKDLKALRQYAPSRMHRKSRGAVIEAMPEVLEDCFVLAVTIPPSFLGRSLSSDWVAATYETICRILLASILQVHVESGFRSYSVALTDIGELTMPLEEVCGRLVKAMDLTLVSKPIHSDLFELSKLIHWSAHRKINSDEGKWIESLQKGFAEKAGG